MKILRHPDEWARGVIGLKPDQVQQGLLFVLPRADIWPITMQGVMIPLDVYWLSESGMVVEHAELFPGMEDCYPEAQASFVMEFPMEDEPRFRIGQFVEIPV